MHEESFYMRVTVSGRAVLRRDAAAAVRRTRSARSRRAASARRAASTGPPGDTRARCEFELGDAQQVVRRRRQRAEAIVQLRGELIERNLARCGGDALVERQP